MVLPSNINICGYPYAVETIESNGYGGSDEMCGDIDYYAMRVRISKDQPPLQERAVLMHELIHGIANHTGQHELRGNENYIDALAYSLVTILRSNPELVKYLTED